MRSRKKLVATALCLIVTLDEGIYTLKRVGGNEKFKAFMEEIEIDPIELEEESVTEEEIGMAIKRLFGKSETTTDIIPVAE